MPVLSTTSAGLSPAANERWRWRAATCGVVALFEYLALSFRFDAQPLGALPGQWHWLGRLGEVPPLLVVIAAVLLAVQAEPLVVAARALRARAALPRRFWPYAVAHGAAFVALLTLTESVFSRGAQTLPSVGSVAAWFAAVVLTLVSLTFVVVPPRAVFSFARTSLTGVAIGGLLGVLVWGAGLATEQLWHAMGQVTVNAVVTLLRVLTDDVWSSGVAV